MKHKLLCHECGATCWVRGDYEDDTNALNLDETREREWEIHGHVLEPGFWCEHEDPSVVDSDCDDDAEDF